MSGYQEAAQRVIDALGVDVARDLLVLLDSPDAVRADAFRQFYERGGHEPLLDALTGLEADPVMRGWLAEHLRIVLEAR